MAKQKNVKSDKAETEIATEKVIATLPEKLEPITVVPVEESHQAFERFISPVSGLLDTVMTEQAALVEHILYKNLQIGETLTAVQAYWEKNLKPKKLLLVHLPDGRLCDLAAAKTKDETLGFWDGLQVTGKIPFGYQMAVKLIKVAAHADKFREIPLETVIAQKLNDMNNAQQLASKFKEGKTVEDYITETSAAAEKRLNAETPKTISIGDGEGKSKISVRYYASKHPTAEGLKRHILNVLLAELGPSAVTVTNKAAAQDQVKVVAATTTDKGK